MSNLCLFFCNCKWNLNLNRNLRSSCYAWIAFWDSTYPTPKSLLKGKGSQTVGHTLLMLNKHLASKQLANTAQKSEYLVYQFLLQSRCECGSGCTETELTERRKKYFPRISLLFDKRNRPWALAPPGRGPLLNLHLPCWGICKATDPTPALVSKYPEFVPVWSSCVCFLRKWIFAGITILSRGKRLLYINGVNREEKITLLFWVQKGWGFIFSFFLSV